ncbi:serine carboxypeptidase-like protein [Medicago truncatula]|uniref:Carboxypeptidase n=1 Tax=Medicago truncatula TaxID=3880 RepID=G7IU63_MEDTR|nr:serine carboxypeptidase-like protein [Medicago truncatula]
MASSLRFLKMCLSFTMFLHFLFFISPSFSFLQLHPKNNDILLSSTLIRGLNLFPKSSINIPENDPLVLYRNIVEKKFTFPGFDDPGYSVEELGHHAGYYSLLRSWMFYFFFESRNSKDDPVVIWLTGGPGCGSEIALFYENGPFQFSKDKNLSLVWNEYGWDKTNPLDQVSAIPLMIVTIDMMKTVLAMIYIFLQTFFKEHPQFAENDFYITGESYAGHYVPAFASRVHQGNKAKEGIHINLKGFAIGNGLTNPEIQYMSYTDYALDNGLINKDEYERINKLIPPCQEATETCGTEGGDACVTSLSICMNIFIQIINNTDNVNCYDIRKKCEGDHCFYFSGIETFLNMKIVKEALGVGDLEFVSCSSTVYNTMLQDWMKNLEVGIPALLEDGIKLLVYAGEKDLICNWLGNSRWIDAMKWSGQTAYKESPTTPFLVDSEEAGILKSHGPLAFRKLKEAGHMVPMDQPKVALQMLQEWMQGKLI